MLLKHFTWQQFLIAALMLSLIWYLVVIPLLCRDSWKNLWKRKSSVMSPEPLAHEWAAALGGSETIDDDLMGKPKLPEGMSRGSMSMLRFAGGEDLEEDRRFRQRGLVPDALEELKSIFQVLEREQGSKQDFIALFGMVKAKYAAIAGTTDELALNGYIRENALFPISDEELDHLWH